MERSSANARLIIVCGLPGSGKTTHARRLETELSAIRFCADEWMEALAVDLWDETLRGKVERLQWQLAQQFLTQGLTVIVEWGTWSKAERDALRLRARDMGVAVDLHYLTAPIDVLYERIQKRCMENPPITREQLLAWEQVFQTPTSEEQASFDKAVTVEQ